MRWLPLLILTACAMAQDSRPATRWYKGNTHTHTFWSDGDGTPELVADWYKSHGYHFLVISDHNKLLGGDKWVEVGAQVLPADLEILREKFGPSWVVLRDHGKKQQMKLKTLEEVRSKFEEPDRFTLIAGEEISDEIQGKPLHHNSINQEEYIKPTGGRDMREAMERTIAAVEAEAKRLGRPVMVHLNHPNFRWAVTPEDVAHVLGEKYFEVYNGHQEVNN